LERNLFERDGEVHTGVSLGRQMGEALHQDVRRYVEFAVFILPVEPQRFNRSVVHQRRKGMTDRMSEDCEFFHKILSGIFHTEDTKRTKKHVGNIHLNDIVFLRFLSFVFSM